MNNNTRSGGEPSGRADRNQNPFCRLWTNTETAEFLQCTTRHLFNLRERGELEAVSSKLGKVLYWPLDVLDFAGVSMEEAMKVGQFSLGERVPA
jgi:hypothetical protein